MRLHDYLSRKEFTILNILYAASPSKSLAPAECSSFGGTVEKVWIRTEVRILQNESQRILGHKLSILSNEELMVVPLVNNQANSLGENLQE